MALGPNLALSSVASAIGGVSRPRAALALDFLTPANFDPRISFTRASSGTYFDSTGRLVSQGYNLLTYSSTFTNAAWTKTDVTPTLSDSSPLDVGYLMTQGVAGTAVALQSGTAVTAGSTITASFVLKRGNNDWVNIAAANNTTTNGVDVWVNLSTGALGNVTAFGTATAASGSVVNLGGGWYRVTATCTPDGTYTIPQAYVRAVTGNGLNTRAANATYYVSAAQLEVGTAANTYSPTTTAANGGPRFDYGPATPAGTVGGELVTNGGFDTATGWGLIQPTSGVSSISGGAVTLQTLDGTYTAATQTLTTVIGKTYQMTVTCLSVSGANPAFTLGSGGGTGVGSVSISAAGTYTVNVTALSTALVCELKRTGGSTNGSASFDNISVKEVTFTPRGLLIEEQRTNLLLHSRDMTQAAWSKTDVTPTRNQVGIDGTANSACLMTEGSAGTALTAQNGAAVTAGSTVTGSFVLKRGNTDWLKLGVINSAGTAGIDCWFNTATGATSNVAGWGGSTNNSASVANLGGGWYRVLMTTTPDGTYTIPRISIQSATAAGSGTRVSGATYIVDAAQLEVGSFATSIITTGAATVTRAADSASMTGTNFSSWFNATQGTVVVDVADANTNGASVEISNGTVTTESVFIDSGIQTYVATTQIYAVGNGSSTGKIAVGYLGGANPGVIACRNGILLVGSPASAMSAGGLSTSNKLVIGMRQFGTALNGHIRRLTYYPTRLPNATLQALTS